MVAHLSSSLGLFAVVWMVLCALSSAVVADAMLRSDDAETASWEDGVLPDGTGLHPGD